MKTVCCSFSAIKIQFDAVPEEPGSQVLVLKHADVIMTSIHVGTPFVALS